VVILSKGVRETGTHPFRDAKAQDGPVIARVASRVLAVALLLAGCTHGERESSAPGEAELTVTAGLRIVGGWVLTDGTVEAQPFPFPAQGPGGTLIVDEDYMGGTFFCNQVGAPYWLDGDRLELGPVGSTLIACSDDLMRAERAYLRVFAAEGTHVSRAGDEIVLSNAAGELHFRRMPLPAARSGSSGDEDPR
jgi:heat shock protein HslJ